MHKYHVQLPQQLPAETQSRLGDLDAVAARLRIKDMGGQRNREVVDSVEDEYRFYTKGVLTRQGDDPLKFWDVRIASRTNDQHTMLTNCIGESRNVSNPFRYCDGLSPCASIRRTMRAHIFIERGNGQEEKEQD